MIYLGIDPGQSGGLAFVRRCKGGRTAVELYFTMPSTEKDLWDSFVWAKAQLVGFGEEIRSLIELVHAMPKQGVSSSFKFGVGYGGLRMALIASWIPFTEVRPRTWQKGLGITPRKKTESKLQFKDRLRAKCQQLFPDLEVWNETLGKQRAVCDAILIAEYGRRTDV